MSYGAFVLERCLQLNLEALSPLDSWKHCYLKLQEGLLLRDHPGLRAACPQSTSAAPGPAGRLELAMGCTWKGWTSRDGGILICKASASCVVPSAWWTAEFCPCFPPEGLQDSPWYLSFLPPLELALHPLLLVLLLSFRGF